MVGELPLMYSCVFWCEFMDLVSFFGSYAPINVMPAGAGGGEAGHGVGI